MWKLIASADRNWGIGNGNRLLVQIPSDMKRFREMTVGQIVVMGRKTLESLPGGCVLEGRKNVVLTANPSYQVKNGLVFHEAEEMVQYLKQQEEEVYVFGGASLYRQLLSLCDTAYVTRIDHAYVCDAYFPDLDRDADWELVSESEEYTYFDLEYRFLVYQRKRG